MDTDDDIAASLPQPPPPAPARRDAAIDAAMRRFDGQAEPARIAKAPQRPTRWWSDLRGPQLGALVSAALVALVGVPAIWLSMSDRPVPVENTVENVEDVTTAPVEAAPQAPAPAAPQTAATPAQTPTVIADSMVVSPPPPAAQAIGRVDAPSPPPPAPPPPPPAQAAMIEQAEIVTTASRAERSENIAALQRRAPSALADSAPKMAAADSEDHSIVVTGSRIDRRKPAGRGDWNACTVNDPSRSLRGCGSLVNPGAKGEAGRAAAHVSDGLSHAWRGDMDGAIAAFDQAIATSPRNAFAYLNRGLARQRNGDTDSAIADLNQAVRYAPRAARGYYNRSLLLRERGDARRARVDEDRAVGIDPAYDAVVQ